MSREKVKEGLLGLRGNKRFTKYSKWIEYKVGDRDTFNHKPPQDIIDDFNRFQETLESTQSKPEPKKKAGKKDSPKVEELKDTKEAN